jgi:hypothetical protein
MPLALGRCHQAAHDTGLSARCQTDCEPSGEHLSADLRELASLLTRPDVLVLSWTLKSAVGSPRIQPSSKTPLPAPNDHLENRARRLGTWHRRSVVLCRSVLSRVAGSRPVPPSPVHLVCTRRDGRACRETARPSLTGSFPAGDKGLDPMTSTVWTSSMSFAQIRSRSSSRVFTPSRSVAVRPCSSRLAPNRPPLFCALPGDAPGPIWPCRPAGRPPPTTMRTSESRSVARRPDTRATRGKSSGTAGLWVFTHIVDIPLREILHVAQNRDGRRPGTCSKR